METAASTAEERTAQRADPAFAEEVFKGLLADDGNRRAACELLARDVITANATAAGKWGITLKRAVARLNVGSIEVLALFEGAFHIIVDRRSIDRKTLEAAGCSLSPEGDEPLYQRVPASLAVDFDAPALPRVLPLISDAHASLIAKAAETPIHSMTPRAHSPGVLRYLESVTGMSLPNPEYDDAPASRKTLPASTLTQLFEEFFRTYWHTDKGRKHEEMYATGRRTAPNRLAEAGQLLEAGKDATDAVLSGMLPHSDTKGNRERGAWIHVAPAVTKDARMLFEGAGWVEPEAWPVATRRVYEFFRNCSQDPTKLGDECSRLGLKGFQSGMLSPFLNALRPDTFLIVNTKSLALINALSRHRFSASIIEYPNANRAGLKLLAEIPEIQAAALQEKIPACDLFDSFSHWLYAEKGWWKDREIEYWKISPGENGRLWEEWKKGGFAAVGWDELGDLAGLSQEEFDARAAEGAAKYPDWKTAGVAQAWAFANIPEGSFVVANEGTTRVLGIGKVSGPYRFEEGAASFKHHLPVEWVDLNEREISKPGWRRTLIRLSKEEFESIRDGRPSAGPWFGPRTFELLELLDKDPTAEVYQAHKAEFKRWVEEPFQALFKAVAAELPAEMKTLLETEERIFSRITKNDYGRGGAWPFYWGAFYPKNGERTKGLQLFASLRPAGLKYGFCFGDYVEEAFEPLAKALRAMPSTEFKSLRADLAARHLLFRVSGVDLGDPIATLDEWLGLQGAGIVAGLAPASDVVSLEADRMRDLLKEAFVAAFPLVQMALGQPVTGARYPLVDDPSLRIGETQPKYDFEMLQEEVGFERENLKTWVRILKSKKQVVLQGPPGTGKTFLALRLAKVLVSETAGLCEVVQFHPAYAYEDFIQGIRPEAKNGGLSYRLEAGRFLDFCSRAAHRDGPCVLIIDEINRANLARVFGELMYLFEYRKDKVPLAAGGEPFRVPDNVHIIGTMNTADRSIARMDYALRRRFAFIRLRPEYGVLQRHLEASGLPAGPLIDVLKGINKAIDDPNFELGISYFMRDGDMRSQIRDVWECEIEPYLEEYFYDQAKKVDAWRWARLVESELQDWA